MNYYEWNKLIVNRSDKPVILAEKCYKHKGDRQSFDEKDSTEKDCENERKRHEQTIITLNRELLEFISLNLYVLKDYAARMRSRILQS